jgi:inner membrane protein
MDNLCHTLVGAALAESGLKRRTALGAATLVIGANFPDIDVLAVPLGRALELRRGVTHGVPAHIVLPFVLTGLMLAWDRLVRRRPSRGEPARPREILLLAALSIATHPFLDFLNSYGMRWLMPLDGRWFYGDSLFIVDLWIWLTLGVGVWLARRRGRRAPDSPARWRPPRVALAAVGAYIAIMIALTVVGRRMVRAELARRGLDAGAPLLVTPLPLLSVGRQVVVALGATSWAPPPPGRPRGCASTRSPCSPT